jgi:cell division protein ZipA
VHKQTEIKVEATTSPITTEKEIPEPTTKPAAEMPVEAEPLDVLVLNVVARDDNELDGVRLLPVLLTLGFKFGEMEIFHRHANSTGHGPVLFSLANMVNPGVFDVDNMEQFSTTGVSLFMRLPHNQGNIKTFNIMLNAAAKIAEEFDGQVLDGNRKILTNQLTNQYVERIRAVERQVSNTK